MADSVLGLVRLPVNQTPGKGSNGDTILRSTENNFYLPLIFIKKATSKDDGETLTMYVNRVRVRVGVTLRVRLGLG